MPEIMTLGDLEVPIRPPSLQSVIVDLQLELTTGRGSHRVWAACVGLCWGGPKAPRADFAKHRFDVLAYGGAVYDELIARGIPGGDIPEAGLRCWRVMAGLPVDGPIEDDTPAGGINGLAEDVQASADFSAAEGSSISG